MTRRLLSIFCALALAGCLSTGKLAQTDGLPDAPKTVPETTAEFEPEQEAAEIGEPQTESGTDNAEDAREEPETVPVQEAVLGAAAETEPEAIGETEEPQAESEPDNPEDAREEPETVPVQEAVLEAVAETGEPEERPDGEETVPKPEAVPEAAAKIEEPRQPAPPPAAQTPAPPRPPEPPPPPPEAAPVPTPDSAVSEYPPAPAAETEPVPRIIILSDDETPSRNVSMKLGQTLLVEYPGAGWVYMGEKNATGIFAYQGRTPERYDPRAAKTTFTLLAKKTGTALLHFYRDDIITNTGTDDYIEVVVNAAAQASDGRDAERTILTGAPPSVSMRNGTPANAPAQTGTPPTASTQGDADRAESRSQTEAQARTTDAGNDADETSRQNVPGTAERGEDIRPPAPREDEVAGLYARALQEYTAKNYQQALASVNGFLSHTNTDIDKGLYLKGQILESESPSQNIKEARAAYNRLVSEFPASALWQDARNRITFLNRFYFDIR
jgi:hypothetical protein